MTTLAEVLMTDFNLTEEDIERLMAAGVLNAEGEAIERDLDLAETEMAVPGAPMRGWGRITRQAMPLEHLGTLARRGVGAYQRSKARNRQEDIQRELAELRMKFLTAGARKPAAPPVGTPPVQGMPTNTLLENNPWAAPANVWRRMP